MKNSVLIMATVSSFLLPFMASAVNIALPAIGADFSMNAVALSWIATAYLLGAAMFLVPLGRVADIVGRKRIFMLGISIFTLISLALALAPSGGLLIALRVLQGVGGTMTFATSTAILMSVFPAKERGHALGITTAAVYIGLAIGPFVGGLLTYNFGWRSVFFVNVPLGIFILAVAFFKLKSEWREADGEKLDLAGTLLYSLALLTIIYGFSLLPQFTGGVLIAVGIVGIAAFIKWETMAHSPMLDLRLFRGNIPFIYSNLAAFINYSATFAVTFLLSLYLQYIKGLSPQGAGIVLVAQPAVMAVLSPLAGRWSDHREPRVVASIGMALTTVGLALLVFLGSATPLSYIVLALIVLGSGFGLFSSPNTNAVMSSVDNRSYGVASAVVGTMRLTGQTFSMGIAMLIFALILGRVQIAPENYPQFLRSTRIAFLLFTVLCGLGVFASLARGKVRQEVAA
jgi:EmrB/QacA subfamily drug resistance transporter